MPNNLYFYRFNGNWYWGTYMQNPGVWCPTFRRKPLRNNRWYVLANGTRFYFSIPMFQNAPVITVENGDRRALIGLFGAGLELINVHNMSYLNLENTKPVVAENFYRYFRNRMNEYRDRYFVPFWKGYKGHLA